ncbi:MAG: M15 family metallopeptidase [Clostridiales bacterium]|nr:M15 family metallopeptidase [Clostridiales bacterium]
MKRVCMLLLSAVLALSTAAGLCETLPAWEFPVSPEVIVNKAGYITLTNDDELLASDYEPGDLVKLTVKRTVQDAQMRKEAAQALTDMFDAAREDGYTLYVKSAYRSYKTQKTMYYNRLEKMGYDDDLVSYPGASDHQTGLGADVLNYAWTQKSGMNERFGETQEAQWMAEHCHEFGFIIRYLSDKEDITHIKYEPWHLRYVGKEAAAYIHANGLCLEEFTAQWRAYLEEYEQKGGDFQALIAERALPNEAIVLDVGDDGEEDFSTFY